ncbi:MAG: DUF5372 family protein [Vicinamibacteraceae bacterium]
MCRYTSRTALGSNKHLGWAEITHPFHPLRGRRFAVLKVRRVSGVETLSLRSDFGGPSSVPREWTDRAEPSPYEGLPVGTLIFDFRCLLELAELLDAVRRSQELDK